MYITNLSGQSHSKQFSTEKLKMYKISTLEFTLAVQNYFNLLFAIALQKINKFISFIELLS